MGECEYEQVRRARMEANKQRMKELGLAEASEAIASEVREKSRKRPRNVATKPLSPPEAARRSARLKDAPAPVYREVTERGPPAERAPRRNARDAGTGGYRPEIYTEEDEKLLGDASEEWVLYKDGYRGRIRVYDAINGKTCHQCRQKTLGLRTHCSQCHIVQGQFCGDCLYTRYGENVKEALQNKEWICPPCRGICNCSVCRKKKGWEATGYMYHDVKDKGYKSVAHFLILTRRGTPQGDVPRVVDGNEEDDKDVEARELLRDATEEVQDAGPRGKTSTRGGRRKKDGESLARSSSKQKIEKKPSDEAERKPRRTRKNMKNKESDAAAAIRLLKNEDASEVLDAQAEALPRRSRRKFEEAMKKDEAGLDLSVVLVISDSEGDECISRRLRQRI